MPPQARHRRAISRAFASAGAAVAVADIDPGRARDAVEELIGSGARAIPLAGDVRSRTAVDDFVAATVAEFHRLDTLVTVVGGQVAFVPAVRLHEISDQDWDLAYEMNLGYVARAARAAIRAFLAGAAKAGLVSLARTVAAEYAGDGIRMNVVACGAIATAVANVGQPADDVPEIPMRRLGLPDDAAAAAVYPASPLSSYVTGQSIVVDGGVTVRGPFAA
ncbi:SDR family oxidoreductase [Actinoplanes sp. NPDC026619]|uniref:SDR family NAD(P)-dependent oxidoreductase n=1 Tax=Actinoplanes sp. NPDC026619 TaxID=3155798 RepID=UPI0033D4C42F